MPQTILKKKFFLKFNVHLIKVDGMTMQMKDTLHYMQTFMTLRLLHEQ